MKFDEFKETIIKELQDFYGKDAEVGIIPVLKNNGKHCEGINVVYKNSGKHVYPIIYLCGFYQEYRNGKKSIQQCVGEIVKLREQYEEDGEIENFAADLLYWKNVKDHVFPVLISAEENRELLSKLVSGRFLDMAVIYIVRGDLGESGSGHVKVSVSMLQQYGISEEELHEQAVINLEKDGYRFQSMDEVLVSLLLDKDIRIDEPVSGSSFEAGKMYIFSNSRRAWGAAGLLNRKLLKQELGEKSCFILPSSIHETIFMPVADNVCIEELSRMVQEVNETQVDISERLSDHCYIWDGNNGVVKMCV